MIDEALLHRIADEMIGKGSFPRVAESEVAAAIDFAKGSDWAPEPGWPPIPGVDEIMRNPQMWVGYGILIGLEAARRS